MGPVQAEPRACRRSTLPCPSPQPDRATEFVERACRRIVAGRVGAQGADPAWPGCALASAVRMSAVVARLASSLNGTVRPMIDLCLKASASEFAAPARTTQIVGIARSLTTHSRPGRRTPAAAWVPPSRRKGRLAAVGRSTPSRIEALSRDATDPRRGDPRASGGRGHRGLSVTQPLSAMGDPGEGTRWPTPIC
jgi:hypothetical protein